MSSGYLRYPHIHDDLLTFTAGDEVWLAPAAGGRAWRLSADDVPVSYPRFSRDGTRVAGASCADRQPRGVLRPGRRQPRQPGSTYWGDPQTRVTGWTRPARCSAVTAANRPAAKYRRAYAVPADGTPPRLLPFGTVTDVAIEEGRHRPADRQRGRRARVLEAVPRRPDGQAVDGHGGGSPCSPGYSLTWMASWPSPMLIGGRLFFLSDHEGTGNICSCGWMAATSPGTLIVRAGTPGTRPPTGSGSCMASRRFVVLDSPGHGRAAAASTSPWALRQQAARRH